MADHINVDHPAVYHDGIDQPIHTVGQRLPGDKIVAKCGICARLFAGRRRLKSQPKFCSKICAARNATNDSAAASNEIGALIGWIYFKYRQ